MYAVVGCSDCGALWVVADRPDSSECPRCGTRHSYGRLRELAVEDEVDAARRARSALLAASQDADLPEAVADPTGVDVVADDEYLREHGIDPEAVREAGERASEGGAGSTGRLEVVREGLRTLDAPDEAAVVEYAGERGVDAGFVRSALERLRERGEVVEDGGYRLV